MKRPYFPGSRKNARRTGDIKRDLSEKQLAALGAVALAYNEVELQIDLLFLQITDIWEPLQLDVVTRINGVDGKLAIISKGAQEFRLDSDDVSQLQEALGDAVFKTLKRYRDALIHTRIFDATFGIGLNVERRGTLSEVLLSQRALDRLYDHLAALNRELEAATRLIGGIKAYHQLENDDPRKEQFAGERAKWSAQFRAHQRARRALLPIPEFPSESELHEAETRWQKAQQDSLTAFFQRIERLQSRSKPNS